MASDSQFWGQLKNFTSANRKANLIPFGYFSPNDDLSFIAGPQGENSNGAVTMRHDIGAATWRVFLPDGTPLNTASSTTQGLQEAINYAQRHAFPLAVYGGGVTSPTLGVPPSAVLSRIICTTTLQFPTGWNNSYDFYNVNLFLFTGNSDGIAFDSSDLTKVDFHDSQILYPGTGNAIHFNPLHDNGEGFAGFTNSTFHLGHVIPVVSTSNLAPDPTKGTAIRITCPNLALGLPFGNGIFVDTNVKVEEVNGGLYGILVENPANFASRFAGNRIQIGQSIHDQGTASIQVGTSSGASGIIFGNRWSGGDVRPINGTGVGISTWAGSDFGGMNFQGDMFDIPVFSGTIGIIANSSAKGNYFHTAMNGATIRYTNNGDASNRYDDSGAPVVIPLTLVSGTPIQNTTGKMCGINIEGGTVSAAAVSGDGSTYYAVPTAGMIVIGPGGYFKATFSVAPTTQVQICW